MKDIIYRDLQNLQIHDLKMSRQTINGGFTWSSFINNKVDSQFLKDLEKILDDLLSEISYNREVGEKEEFENYLFSIKETMDKIISGLKTNTEESDNKRMIAEKVHELQGRLINIPEYKIIYKKSHKSTSGNQKIEWKKQVNQLAGFFLLQLERGYIETDPENLKLFLMNNFTWKGKPLVENSMNTYFDPNKKYEKLPKGKRQIDPKDFLTESE